METAGVLALVYGKVCFFVIQESEFLFITFSVHRSMASEGKCTTDDAVD